jgi:hypothetical protein
MKGIDSMLLRITARILKVFFCAVGAAVLIGCAMELPHVPELGFNWISKEGKSQEQLYADQTACRREISMLYPPDSSGPGNRSWDMSDMRAFDACMRSKGWIKQ